MTRENDVFYNNFHIPIVVVFLGIVWIAVGTRFCAFSPKLCGWRSWRGGSTVLITLSGTLCTLYTALAIAGFVLNKRVLKIRDKESPYMLDGYRDPAYYSGAELATVINTSKDLLEIEYAMRMTLIVALWMAKFAFIAIFLETGGALGKVWRTCLYLTALTIGGTFGASLWGVSKDYIAAHAPELMPSPEQIRNGVYIHGIRCILLENLYEFIITGTNMFTDLLIVLVACRTVRALNQPIMAAKIVFIMATVTLLAALGRLILIGLLMNNGYYDAFGTIPLQVLSESEAFLAVIVSCLPGIRAFLRARRHAKDERQPDEMAQDFLAQEDKLCAVRI